MRTHFIIANWKWFCRNKNEDFVQLNMKCNELKLEMENLNSLINQKVDFSLFGLVDLLMLNCLTFIKNLDKRNLIQKEYGYDDALISLQNDINDLETKFASLLVFPLIFNKRIKNLIGIIGLFCEDFRETWITF